MTHCGRSRQFGERVISTQSGPPVLPAAGARHWNSGHRRLWPVAESRICPLAIVSLACEWWPRLERARHSTTAAANSTTSTTSAATRVAGPLQAKGRPAGSYGSTTPTLRAPRPSRPRREREADGAEPPGDARSRDQQDRWRAARSCLAQGLRLRSAKMLH